MPDTLFDLGRPLLALPTAQGTYDVTEDDYRRWAERYPELDMGEVLLDALAYLLAQPRSRPTKKGVGNFVANQCAHHLRQLPPYRETSAPRFTTAAEVEALRVALTDPRNRA